MEKLFWKIGEVAQLLGENVSLIRFWTNSFPALFKVSRTTRGTRQYTAEDIETLRQIHYLVKTKGMSLEAAQQQLLGERAAVSNRVKVLQSLKAIREQLVQIRKNC